MENIENKEIVEEVEISDLAEVNPGCEHSSGDVALGTAIIGGLSVLAWEFAIKPLGKKVIAVGKNTYRKVKDSKRKKLTEVSDDAVEVIEE